MTTGTAPRRRTRPAINRDTQFFWDGVAEGELRIQRCDGCQTLRHTPRPMCDRCHSTEWTAEPMSGRGTIHSFVIHHHPALPGVDSPHPVVLVDLEEGVRFLSEMVVGTDPADVEIGRAVQVEFEAVDDELTLPKFRFTEDA